MSEIRTENALLKEALQKLNIGMKAIVPFTDEGVIMEFVAAVMEEFPNEKKDDYPTINSFSFKANKDTGKGIGNMENILNNLPATLYFESLFDILRFAFDYKAKGREVNKASNGEKKNTPVQTDKQYSVNPEAEEVLDDVASSVKGALVFVGILQLIGGIVGGIIMLSQGELFSGVGIVLIVLGVVFGLVFIFLGRFLWAFAKLFINMSRNLFKIENRLTNKEQ